MKKIVLTVLLSVLTFTLMASATTNETFLRLPVRVLSGGAAVENLTIDDFNLSIDGERQEITHFIKMNRSLAQSNSPRNFVLAFNIKDYYGQQIANSISYFVKEILKEGDSLVVWTPVKVYVIPNDNDKDNIGKAIQEIVKKDTLQYKNDIINSISTLNEIIKKYKIDSEESIEDTYKSKRTAAQFFLTAYSRELKNYKDRFILPNMMKIREIAGILAEKNGQKWIINFQERDIIPNLVAYKEVAAEIFEMAARLAGNDMANGTRMQRVLDFIEKTMFISIGFPMNEISAALVDANISYNVILFKGIGERTTVGDSVSHDVDKTFKYFSTYTGGTAVVTANIIEGLDRIRSANDTYYDLIFKIQDQSKEKTITVDLPKRPQDKPYYKELFTKNEIAALIGGLNEASIGITGFDLKDQKLKFSISGYCLNTSGNNQGLIKILVNLFDEKNAVVYKTQRTLKSQEKSIDFALELPAKYKGDFTLSINAVDLVSLKSIQLNTIAKL